MLFSNDSIRHEIVHSINGACTLRRDRCDSVIPQSPTMLNISIDRSSLATKSPRSVSSPSPFIQQHMPVSFQRMQTHAATSLYNIPKQQLFCRSSPVLENLVYTPEPETPFSPESNFSFTLDRFAHPAHSRSTSCLKLHCRQKKLLKNLVESKEHIHTKKEFVRYTKILTCVQLCMPENILEITDNLSATRNLLLGLIYEEIRLYGDRGDLDDIGAILEAKPQGFCCFKKMTWSAIIKSLKKPATQEQNMRIYEFLRIKNGLRFMHFSH